jgi:hypothetical protein
MSRTICADVRDSVHLHNIAARAELAFKVLGDGANSKPEPQGSRNPKLVSVALTNKKEGNNYRVQLHVQLSLN